MARAFFIFVAADLVVRSWGWALLISLAINLVYELTVGRKFWRAWKNQPKRPRRKLGAVLKSWWHRVFCRERTRGLVITGVVVLLMSWLVPLNIYYIVCAVVLFSLAAISRFAPPGKSAILPCESAGNPTSGAPDCPPSATK